MVKERRGREVVVFRWVLIVDEGWVRTGDGKDWSDDDELIRLCLSYAGLEEGRITFEV